MPLLSCIICIAFILMSLLLPPALAVYDIKDNAITHAQKGQQHLILGTPENAIEEFKLALRLNGHDSFGASLYNNLGVAYQKTKRYTMAIASFQRACRIRPGTALYYKNLIDSYQLAGVLDIAEARLIQNTALNSNQPEVWYLLGLISQANGNNQNARNHFLECISLQADGPLADAAKQHLKH
ncbi:MAG: tetratricopeptide repeat protein [Cyanobacteria bacterium P01_H01_bin.74]